MLNSFLSVLPRVINARSMLRSRLFCVGCAFFLLSGCATMFNGGSQTMRVSASNDAKVKVAITTPDGGYSATLPANIVSSPSSFDKVTIKSIDTCYDPVSVNVNQEVTPAYFANLLIWPGFIVDYVTGKMWKYDNQTSLVVSKKEGATDCPAE